ncbi:NEN2-like protein [Drosera capensis]
MAPSLSPHPTMLSLSSPPSDHSQSPIAFFDVETTVPTRPGQGFEILEFGAILVCPRKLVELDSFEILVRPSDLALVSERSVRCNGITREAVAVAPRFGEIAEKVYELLHGRIWAGHNILRFDCVRIKEAFEAIGRPPPEPKGTIDSLALLTQKFGRRAGNMKMATLATYFGLGQQTHRSLDDVRMNLEVVKYCATVLFLESSLPDVLTCESSSSNVLTRGRRNRRVSAAELNVTPTAVQQLESQTISSPPTNEMLGEQILSFVDSDLPDTESFNMSRLAEQIQSNSLVETITMDENPLSESPGTLSPALLECRSGSSAFLAPEDLFIPAISASLVPFYRGGQRIQILHDNIILKLLCTHLKVRFGISTKFLDHTGRPRLSFVVDGPPEVCDVLDECDRVAQRLFLQFSSTSDWRPLVTRKNGYWNFPTIRINIPTLVTGDVASYATEIYQKEAASGAEQKLSFSRFDAAELGNLFTPGKFIDAFISLDPFDYQQNAGIRLVAEKLVIRFP